MGREAIGEVVVDGVRHPIELDLEAGRLEIRARDAVAFIRLRARGPVFSLIHTEVPDVLRGGGVANALARTALAYARAQGLTVKPFCPFVQQYLRRHPDELDLVDPEFTLPAGPGPAA